GDPLAVLRPALAMIGELGSQLAALGIAQVAGLVGVAARPGLVHRQARLAFKVAPGHVHAAMHLTGVATAFEVAGGGAHLRRRSVLEIEFIELVATLLELAAAALRQQLPGLGQVLRQAQTAARSEEHTSELQSRENLV